MNLSKPLSSSEINKEPNSKIDNSISNVADGDNVAVQTSVSDSEVAANNLSSLMDRVSAKSAHEIDSLIYRLQSLHERLQTDRIRVQRDLTEYAALNQSVMQSDKDR